MAITNYVQALAPNLLNKEIQTLLIFYMAWVSAHYVSTHIYTYFCYLCLEYIHISPCCIKDFRGSMARRPTLNFLS